MKAWERIEPTSSAKVGWRTIVTKTFRRHTGQELSFDLLHPDGQEFVGVIALTPENKVVIARQFRPGPEMVMEELPGGFVDEGETPVQAAERELLEETGYKVGTIEYVGKFHKDTYMNAVWHICLARDCTQSQAQQLEENEDVEVDTISIKQLIENAKTDKMTDHGSVLTALDELQKLL